MSDQRRKKRPKRILWIGGIGMIVVIMVLGVFYYIESISDPVIVEVLFNDTSTGESLSKITHLKDGTIDYVFNYTESIGTSTTAP